MATTPTAGVPVKTWVLRVSIHCEGCKKKVKKVLHSIEGVYDTNIDTKQQKVIVTGNVEADTLIIKLLKSGKNAELWPEPIIKEKKQGKLKKKEKQIDPKPKTANQEEAHKEPEKKLSALKIEEIPQEIVKKIEVNPTPEPKKDESSSLVVKIANSEDVAEPKADVAEPKADVAETKADVNETKAEKKPGECETRGNTSGDKKKKGPKNPAEGGSSPHILTNQSPPRHHGYEYPPYYHAPQPVYAVSYNTAHPSSSYTASYYAPPPPYSYAYTHTGQEMQHPPSDIDSYPRQPLDSFEMFSDENPNGCYIMW